MAEPPRKKRDPTPPPINVVEENVAPQLLKAQPVQRSRTPAGMLAPPIEPPDRKSYDDLEHIATVDRLERERVELLAENRRLREQAPTFIFPPQSVPPSADPSEKPPIEVAPTPHPSEKFRVHQRIKQIATGLGVGVAIAWNAFNSYRSTPEKVEAVQTRLNQSEQQRTEEITQRVLKDQREAQRWRAVACWAKQLRGASQRQGLDLPSLPGGGVKALRLDQGDPSKPPAFVAEEKCPDFPPLPPDPVAQ